MTPYRHPQTLGLIYSTFHSFSGSLCVSKAVWLFHGQTVFLNEARVQLLSSL